MKENNAKSNIDAHGACFQEQHIQNKSQSKECFDILLSDITIKFDNEVETLYFGPITFLKEEPTSEKNHSKIGNENIFGM